MRCRGLFVVLLLTTPGCPNTFEDPPEALIGSWELQDIDGLVDRTVQGGELEVAEVASTSLAGDLEWNASCALGGDISVVADITSVDVESSTREYSIELLQSVPESSTLDWECTLSEPELECVQSGDDGVLVFEFRREGA